jgi:hypothetical protein
MEAEHPGKRTVWNLQKEHTLGYGSHLEYNNIGRKHPRKIPFYEEYSTGKNILGR